MKQIPTYFVDGGTANNGEFGNQKSFICITDFDGKELVFEEVGDMTNNEAELTAILRCIKLNKKPKIIISDSQLAVNLVKKKWHTKIDRLNKILEIINKDKNYGDIVWKPRESNKSGWIIQERLNL